VVALTTADTTNEEPQEGPSEEALTEFWKTIIRIRRKRSKAQQCQDHPKKQGSPRGASSSAGAG